MLYFLKVQNAVSVLLDHFYKETDTCVKAKIANLLGELMKTPDLDPVPIADDIKTMIKVESKLMQSYL